MEWILGDCDYCPGTGYMVTNIGEEGCCEEWVCRVCFQEVENMQIARRA